MQTSPPAILSEPANQDADSRLREFAHNLAKSHIVEISRPQKNDLLGRLKSWEQVLHNANTIFKATPAKEVAVSRAGEWMLDNFYIVKQTFRQIEEDLPVDFLNQLPKLAGAQSQQQMHSRIFALAWEWIGYSQSQIDLIQVATFVRDYQQVASLKTGELWALPIMLRIGILERLVYAVTELLGMDVPTGLSEIPNQFTPTTLANETIVANCFLSLRLLLATDWKDFFEQISRVEQILRNDPAEIYAAMDFDTRNKYRSVIEELAHYSDFTEEQVALAAVELAHNADENALQKQKHVGFYLIDAGRTMLEASLNYQL